MFLANTQPEAKTMFFAKPGLIGMEMEWIQFKKHSHQLWQIERTCFEFPWAEEQFSDLSGTRNCMGIFATIMGKMAGFVIYKKLGQEIAIQDLAVKPCLRLRRIGARLVAELIGKLAARQRGIITAIIGDTNIGAHLFFRKMGFIADRVLKEYYEETAEDAYYFCYEYIDRKTERDLKRLTQ